MRKKNSVFSPMATIKNYLAGKPVSRKDRLVIRKAIAHLLLLGWQSAFTALPELAIAKDTPLMELPYLNDREKVWMARISRSTTVGEADEFFRECLSESDLRNFCGLLGIKGYGALYHYGESEKPVLPCDFRTLRVCILLYRPYKEWTVEERAIMREGGIKIDPKHRERKFYRPSW